MALKKDDWKKIFCGALTAALVLAVCGWFAVRQRLAEAAFAAARAPGETVVIDAGHGGGDGGAVSITGVAESGINLSIALRLDQLLGFYGVETKVLRTTEDSLHDADSGTLREKKVTDLHNRVEMIEATENATLISIHQNSFQNPKYHGAQVFYANGDLSLPLAQSIQETLRLALDPENNRVATKIPESVYLMNHISCRAILVECGFLTNPEEDLKLQDTGYQTKIAAALAGGYLQFQGAATEGELPNEG